MGRILAVVAVLLAFPAAAADLKPGPQGEPERKADVGDLRQQEHRVPFKADGGGPLLQAILTLPNKDGPAPGIVITHGSPRKAEDRRRQSPFRNTTRWFADRGFVVLNLTRRGYGKSQGDWEEGYGKCDFPYYKEAGDKSAEDMLAAIRYLRALPTVDKNRIVVAGVSAGGWGTLATAARNPDGVVLALNFAGGRGSRSEGEVCGGEYAFREPLKAWGAKTKVPTLWLYAENDRFWGSDMPKKMFALYRAAGAPAELWAAPPFPHHRDGHMMFGHGKGAGFWGDRVEKALKAVPGLMR